MKTRPICAAPGRRHLGSTRSHSQTNGGNGLSVSDIKGIYGEDRAKQEEAQKATTSPSEEAIGKSATNMVRLAGGPRVKAHG